MRVFYDRIHELKIELSTMLAHEDWEHIRDIAHTLKGSGGSYGYPEISRLGADICNGIDNEQFDNLAEIVVDLLFKMSRIEVTAIDMDAEQRAV